MDEGIEAAQCLPDFASVVPKGEDLHRVWGWIQVHLASESGELVLSVDLLDLRDALLDQDATEPKEGWIEVGAMSINECRQLAGDDGGAGNGAKGIAQ